MKRIRLSTLMLLIVIASLILALIVQQRQAARREAALRAQIPGPDLRTLYWFSERNANVLSESK